MRYLVIVLLCFSNLLFAQEQESIYSVVYLDSFVVTAARQGFDAEDFIRLVREDESFYKAFRNLRFLSYDSDNAIEIFDKSNAKIALYDAKTRQTAKGRCRTMEVLDEQIDGNYYKRKRKPRYYTARMYERLFFTEGEECEAPEGTAAASSGMIEKRIEQLKRLIFQPGERVDVPLIGNKTAIFSPEMQSYYDYAIRSKSYQGKIDCYVFSAKAKANQKESKTVIKYLETYFDKETFQVVARQYRLKHFGTAFDFDVTMDIQLRKLGKLYVPKQLYYKGFWDIPTQKPEFVEFSTRFYSFK